MAPFNILELALPSIVNRHRHRPDTSQIAPLRDLQALRNQLLNIQSRMKLLRLTPKQHERLRATTSDDQLDLVLTAISFAMLRPDIAEEAETPVQLWRDLANMDLALAHAERALRPLMAKSGRGALLLGAELTERGPIGNDDRAEDGAA